MTTLGANCRAPGGMDLECIHHQHFIPGAVVLRGSKGWGFDNCTFQHLGGSGVQARPSPSLPVGLAPLAARSPTCYVLPAHLLRAFTPRKPLGSRPHAPKLTLRVHTWHVCDYIVGLCGVLMRVPAFLALRPVLCACTRVCVCIRACARVCSSSQAHRARPLHAVCSGTSRVQP